MKLKKIWLVPHPTSQFNEDVKELASDKGLRIIDAKFSKEINAELVEKNTPKLTKTDEQKAKEKEKEKAAK